MKLIALLIVVFLVLVAITPPVASPPKFTCMCMQVGVYCADCAAALARNDSAFRCNKCKMHADPAMMDAALLGY